MKLYGQANSMSTRKVLMLLAEKGAEAEFVPVDLVKGEHTSQAFLAKHPFGKVPVLEDDGFEVYETRAIVGYLDAKLPGPSLLPDELRERAQAEQWISIESSYFGEGTVTLLYQCILHPWFGKPSDAAAIERAREGLRRGLDLLDQTLARQPYLVGTKFSLADIYMMPGLQVLVDGKQGDLIESRASLARWWSEIASRASWRNVLARAQG